MSIELDTINDIIGKSDNSVKIAQNKKKREKAVKKEVRVSKPAKKRGRPAKEQGHETILNDEVYHPLWLSVSEAAKMGGVTTKTIRRALQDQKIKFKIIQNRYQLDLRSTILFLYSNKKLENKLKTLGIGQYIVKWKE